MGLLGARPVPGASTLTVSGTLALLIHLSSHCQCPDLPGSSVTAQSHTDPTGSWDFSSLPGGIRFLEAAPNPETKTTEILVDLLFSMMAKALKNRNGKKARGSIG